MNKNLGDYDKYYHYISKPSGYYVLPLKIFDELFDEYNRLKEINKEHQEINGKLREELNIYKNIINLFNNGKIYFDEMMEKFKELEESGK